MADREAKVTFRANTSQFNAGISQMSEKIKTFRSELKLNATQLKGAGDSIDTLKNRQSILKSELSASREKVVLLNAKLTEAKKIFGDNSVEVQKLSRELTEAKNVETGIQNEINQTNAKIREQERANSTLSQSISKCDSEVKKFDQELELNATKLQGAANKTELLKERQTLLANQSQAAGEKVKILERSLEQCGEEVGRNSQEYLELKGRLKEAKTHQAAIQNEIRNTANELKNQKTQLQQTGEALGTFGKEAENAGRNVRVVSATAATGIAATAASAVQFESAFAGVKKTSDEVYDANGKCVYSYKQLEDGIRNMSKEIPASTTEIAGVAEVAGQLGIKTQDILGFTRVMIDMGQSTNLASEEAAGSISKFANITGLAADKSMTAKEKYGRLGSVIVDLGNKYATTERDIVEMAQNLASAGTQVGMSESDILALAASLSSVGMEAEAGGSSFSKAMIKMQLAVETNSESLNDWASVAGMSAEEFSKAFKEDATGALQAFIQGLSECGGETESAIKILDDMGITETRMRDSLLRSANASDLFTSAIQTGRSAWEENAALTEEANKRYETTASQLSIMKNHINDVGITLGAVFLPMINSGAKKISELCKNISELDTDTQKMLLGFTAFIALLYPILTGIGKISTGISGVIGMGSKITGLFAGIGKAGASGGAAAAAGMSLPLAPVVAIVAGVGALIAIIVVLWKKSESFRDFFTGMWEGLKQTVSGFLEKINFGDKIEAIKNKFRELGEKLKGLSDLFIAIGAVVAAVAIPILGVLAGVFEALLNTIEPIITIIEGVVDVLAGLGQIIVGVFTGDLDKAKEGLNLFNEGVGEIFGGLWDLVYEALTGFVEGIVEFFGSLLDVCGISGFIDSVKDKFHGLVDTVSETFSTIGNAIQVAFMAIAEIFNIAWQIISLPFQMIWQSCKDTVLQVWEEIKTLVLNAVNNVRDTISSVFGVVSGIVSSIWNGIKDRIFNVWEMIKSVVSGAVEGVKGTVSSGFAVLKTYIIDPVQQAYNKVVSIFTNIKNSISDKINGAKDAVRSAIDRIKGFFNFSWSLPHLKLPSIKITGSFSLNPPSVPHFSLAWHKLGAIFTKPTIFPTNSGYHGIGEAGAEAVLPISNLITYVEDAMNRVIERTTLQNYEPLDYDKLAEASSRQQFKGYMNGREVVRMLKEEW